MSLSNASRKEVINYYFKGPNSKAILEDGLDVARADVEDFLTEVHVHLIKTLDNPQPNVKQQLDAVIEIPRLEHFRFGHGRDVVMKRKKQLEQVNQQIHKAKEWLSRETKYMQANCNHSYASTGDGDGSSQDWCRDCGAR